MKCPGNTNSTPRIPQRFLSGAFLATRISALPELLFLVNTVGMAKEDLITHRLFRQSRHLTHLISSSNP
jgi:hypothetical protein